VLVFFGVSFISGILLPQKDLTIELILQIDKEAA
jgi:hypothetical protein